MKTGVGQSRAFKQCSVVFLIGALLNLTACSESKDEEVFFSNSKTSDGSPGSNGLNGQDGKSCWEAEGIIDKNEDNKIDAADCIGETGLQGETGAAGVACWTEIGDANNDGELNSADCRYSIQRRYSALEIEDVVQGDYDNIFVPDDVESVVIGLQKFPNMPNSGRYCARINLEKLCGDADGCLITMTERHKDRNDDFFDTHRWKLMAENYDLFFNPANETQAYPEKSAGISYRSIHAGSNNSWAVTGFTGGDKRLIAWSQGSHVYLDNNSRGDCNNFDSGYPRTVHAEPHVFTLSVHHNYMGTIVITDTH